MQQRSGEFLIDTSGNKDMSKGTTIVLCFSRSWCIKEFFKSFDKLKIRKKDFHLLVFDNTDNVVLSQELRKATTKYVFKFKTYRYYKSWRQGGRIRMHQGEKDVMKSKIPAIYQMQKDIANLITTEIFVQIEDDTVFPENSVKKLLNILKKEKNCAVATACETGRSRNRMLKMRLGIHYVKKKGDKITERLSFAPWLKGLHDCQACGWYLFAAKMSVWKKAFEKFDTYWSTAPRWGLDVAFTNEIHRLGYRIVADFDLWCEHMQLVTGKILFWGREDACVMADIWIPEYNEYAQGVLIKEENYEKARSRFL